MSNKLFEFLAREEAGETSTEETKSEEVVDTTKQEENIEETPVVSTPSTEETEPVVTQPVVETTKVTEEVTNKEEIVSTPKKVKVDYKDFIERNREEIKRYLNDSSTDYSQLDNVEVLKLKIKNDNPDWTKEDVEAELSDKYSLDLADKDFDDLSSEEQNNLKRGERLLKSDAKKAKDELNSLRATAESLPEFELELAQEETPVVENTFNEEDYTAQMIEQNEKLKTEVWIPTLKNTLSEIESLTETIPYEDGDFKGEINVSYKLSDLEKEEVLTHLSEYIANPSDNKYVKEDGSVDYKGFVADKTKELNFKKLLKTAVKEARASARQDFIEKDLVNYSEEVRNVAQTETVVDDLDWFKRKGGKTV